MPEKRKALAEVHERGIWGNYWVFSGILEQDVFHVHA